MSIFKDNFIKISLFIIFIYMIYKIRIRNFLIYTKINLIVEVLNELK